MPIQSFKLDEKSGGGGNISVNEVSDAIVFAPDSEEIPSSIGLKSPKLDLSIDHLLDLNVAGRVLLLLEYYENGGTLDIRTDVDSDTSNAFWIMAKAVGEGAGEELSQRAMQIVQDAESSSTVQ